MAVACRYAKQGCTDSEATNYDTAYDTDDGSCIYAKFGCTDRAALNFDSTADFMTLRTCISVRKGCLDSTMFNYVADANTLGPCKPMVNTCGVEPMSMLAPILSRTCHNPPSPLLLMCLRC